MRKYQAFYDFTAQGKSVQSVYELYALFERSAGQGVPIAPIVVFLAFAVESYLNSIGARVIPFWDEMERLPWRQKVNALHKAANRAADWGQEPLQFATEVFRLRDNLAHGKPERVVSPKVFDRREAEELLHGETLQPEWFKSINLVWAVAAKDRFRVLMAYLSSLFAFHESDHLLGSSGGVLVHDEPDA